MACSDLSNGGNDQMGKKARWKSFEQKERGIVIA